MTAFLAGTPLSSTIPYLRCKTPPPPDRFFKAQVLHRQKKRRTTARRRLSENALFLRWNQTRRRDASERHVLCCLCDARELGGRDTARARGTAPSPPLPAQPTRVDFPAAHGRAFSSRHVIETPSCVRLCVTQGGTKRPREDRRSAAVGSALCRGWNHPFLTQTEDPKAPSPPLCSPPTPLPTPPSSPRPLIPPPPPPQPPRRHQATAGRRPRTPGNPTRSCRQTRWTPPFRALTSGEEALRTRLPPLRRRTLRWALRRRRRTWPRR